MSKQERYHELLLSLGVALYGEPPADPADPEKSIIELVETFYDDQKFFRLLLAWLSEAGELVHIERLLTLSKDMTLSNTLILCAVAMKQVRNGDRRWGILAKRLRKRIKIQQIPVAIPVGYDSEFLIQKHGADPEFEKLGWRIALITPEERKKIMSLDGILRTNRWLKFRALIGANFRADIAYIFSRKLASNPNQAAKLAKCSRETAYRLWHWISLAEPQIPSSPMAESN